MIPYGRHCIDESDIKAVSDVLRSGALTQGPLVEAFENAVATYTGSRYAVAVSSATAGLHLAAIAAGVGPGTALVTTPITFIASANAAQYAGGDTLFADVDARTVNMDPAELEKVLAGNPNVRTIVPVHYAGLPCDMAAISKMARAAGAHIIEDAAHALGGHYADGAKVGSNAHSDMTVFSFHPVKAVAAGEGGVVTTNNEAMYRHLLRLRSHGVNKLDDPLVYVEDSMENGKPNPWYYEMTELGYHYRITDIQSALALSQLSKLDQFIARRRELALAYDAAFADFSNLRPAQPSEGRHNSGHHLYVLRIAFDRIGISRGDLMRMLRERGIGSQVHYIPVTSQPYYRERGHNTADFPQALSFYNEALSIPLFYELSDEDQAKVISTLHELVG